MVAALHKLIKILLDFFAEESDSEEDVTDDSPRGLSED